MTTNNIWARKDLSGNIEWILSQWRGLDVRVRHHPGDAYESDGRIIITPEKWLQVIVSAYDGLEDLSREVMRGRYWLRESYVLTALRIHVSDRTYYSMVEDVRAFVVMVAVQFGLIRVV